MFLKKNFLFFQKIKWERTYGKPKAFKIKPILIWVITTPMVGWSKESRDMNFNYHLKASFGFGLSPLQWQVRLDMDFLKDETRYVSSRNNQPNGGVLYLVTMMSRILVIHLEYESGLPNVGAFMD